MLWMVYAFVIGLVFGSFANVVIYRIPRGLSIVAPPSACTACGRRLTLLDLVPIASWLALKARCRYCRASVSMRYPVVELGCGMLFSSMVFYTESFSVIPLAFLWFLLLCVSMIDIDAGEIPMGLVSAGAVAGVAWVAGAHFVPELFPLAPVWHTALLGVVVAAALSWLVVFARVGFGFGNRQPLAVHMANGLGYVKLASMLGLFLGWQKTLLALWLAGVVFAVFTWRYIRKKDKPRLPFAPFLSGGGLIALWFGQPILHIIGIG